MAWVILGLVVALAISVIINVVFFFMLKGKRQRKIKDSNQKIKQKEKAKAKITEDLNEIAKDNGGKITLADRARRANELQNYTSSSD